MPYRLFAYARSSASWRVRVGLELVGADYEVVPVRLGRGADGEQFSDAHRRRNPMGQVPALELPDGRRLAQSIAILEYLADTHPGAGLLPADPYLRARARMLAEIVNAGTQPLQNIRVTQRIADLGGDERQWGRRAVDEGLSALEASAADTAGAFLVGDTPTVADVCLVPQLYNARNFGCDVAAWPTLLRAEAACAALPAFQRARPEVQPDYEVRVSPR